MWRGRPTLGKEKTNGYVVLKTGGWWGQLRKKENMNGIVGAKNRGQSRPLKEKRETNG